MQNVSWQPRARPSGPRRCLGAGRSRPHLHPVREWARNAGCDEPCRSADAPCVCARARACLCVSCASNGPRAVAYVFYERLLTEIFGRFPDRVFHIGGDEVEQNAPRPPCPPRRAPPSFLPFLLLRLCWGAQHAVWWRERRLTSLTATRSPPA